MHILLVTDRMDHGGAETHIAQLAKGLSSLRLQVTLLSSGGAGADALEREGIAQIRLPSLCRRSPAYLLKNTIALRRILRRESFSLIHAHARLPALLLRLAGTGRIPVLVTAHAILRETPLLRRLSFWGTRTVAVSEDIRQHLLRAYGLPAERITVIPNGIDLSAFAPCEKPSPHQSTCVSFVSRLDADCSLGAWLLCEIAPRLAEEFPSLTLRIAGGGSDHSALLRRAQEINRTLGRKMLSLMGWVNDMPSFLRESDVVVGVSRVAMEAAASGCAVILCGNEGYLGPMDAKNASRAAKSNLCCRGEAQATAERLRLDLLTLLADPAERARVAAEGNALVRASFSAERMCRETLALYRRLLPSPSPKKGKRILVGGYFGCGNAGDDAILLGLLRLLRDADPSVTVRALTGDPRRDARRFGIPCHGRKNPLSLLLALSRSDLFLCGGGSLLQNRTGSLSLLYYLTLLRLAKALGRKTVLFAAGIGPIRGENAWRKTLFVLSRIDRVSLRDDASLACLRRAGLPEHLLLRGADTALWMPLPDPSRGEMLLDAVGLPPKGEYLAVLLREARDPTLLPRMMQAVQALCRSSGLTPLWIPLDMQADRSCSAQAASECGGTLLLPCEPGDVAALLSVCRVGITLRLHGAILGAAVGTPMLSLTGDPLDPKLPSFASCMGMPCVSDPEALPQEICALLARDFGEEQRRSVAAERKKAWKGLANVLEMLYNKDGQSDCHFQE